MLFDARGSENSFLHGNWPERPAAGVGELAGYVEPCYSGERAIWSRLAKKLSSSLAACCRSVSSWHPKGTVMGDHLCVAPRVGALLVVGIVVDTVGLDHNTPAVGQQEQEVHPLAGQRYASPPRVGVIVKVDLQDQNWRTERKAPVSAHQAIICRRVSPA
jgi:hypothetical protein